MLPATGPLEAAGVGVMSTGAGGALEQPDRLPTIASTDAVSRAVIHRAAAWFRLIHRSCCMALLLLEALLALVILIAIVWWTMFSGRDKGELKAPEAQRGEDIDKP
jgi:hypothetical protein